MLEVTKLQKLSLHFKNMILTHEVQVEEKAQLKKKPYYGPILTHHITH